jgi:hypothetical protein
MGEMATDDRPANDKEAQQQEAAAQDVLTSDYRTVLNELAVLTTVSVLLFGFLLGSSARAAGGAEEWVYVVAMVCVASATMVFILPVAYHHVEFPYRNFNKFVARSHFWVRVGLPFFAAGLYLSLCIAIWHLFKEAALVIAALPFLATGVAFVTRRGQL